MRRYLISALAMGVLSTISWSVHAEPNEMNCIGITADHTVISVGLQQDEEIISAKIQYGQKIESSVDGLESRLTYQTKGASTLHFGSDVIADVITIQRLDNKSYSLHFRFPELSVGSLKPKINDGETIAAYCTVYGRWAKQLESVTPETIEPVMALLNNASPDSIESAVLLAHNSNYSPDDKQRVYQSVLNDKSIQDDVRDFTLAAAFSDNLSSDFQLALIDGLQHQPKVLSTAVGALAECFTCQISPDVYSKTAATLKEDLADHTEGVSELWYAVAKLSFQKRTEKFSDRVSTIEILFSNEALSLNSSSEQLSHLADILLSETLGAEAPSDLTVLLSRVLNHPKLDKTAAVRIHRFIIQNHASRSNALPSLSAQILLTGIETLEKRELLQANGSEKAWLKGESLVDSTAPEQMLNLLRQRPTDFAVIENILSWMTDQTEAVPNGQEIIVTILSGLKSVDSRYLQFNFENRKRGILPDLCNYAFSAQAQALGNSALVLRTVLSQKQIGNDLLQNLGRTVADSVSFSQMESEELFSLIVSHPNYIEARTAGSPHGLVTNLLEKAVNSEKWGSKTKSKFSVSYLNSQLQKILSDRRIDNDDMKELSTKLVEQTDSI